MDLKIKDQYFLVGGAGSGFGRAVALSLAAEGARVLAVSRTAEKLESLKAEFPSQIDILSADLSLDETHQHIADYYKNNQLSGIFVNAGGPPAGGFSEINMQQWDEGWRTIVRWKIALIQRLLPMMQKNHYGRILFLESISVKQPIPNLILSNALRAAVMGFAKTLSSEVASLGITVNLMAPGYHDTAAMDRIFRKKSELEGISFEEAKRYMEKEIPVGKMGRPEDLASLATWLLSPNSQYITGQTISHTGGLIKGMF
ncbi:MAG: SDR family oxidoreductase [Bacteroidales bacterium]|nr:SDR family oxidoreductase [Bacteroidales bacterium]